MTFLKLYRPKECKLNALQNKSCNQLNDIEPYCFRITFFAPNKSPESSIVLLFVYFDSRISFSISVTSGAMSMKYSFWALSVRHLSCLER